jgi:phosphoribosylglycinamide formyltransferase-1
VSEEFPRTHRLGILLSGRGSNFLAISEAIEQGRIANARIAVVISNRRDAPGISLAQNKGLATEVIEPRGRPRAEHDADIIASLQAHQVDLVCLAGYMRLLSVSFVRAFPQRILNIHPSLLPAFPGLAAQRQALEYGVTVSGCTVHFVDEELDHGVIVVQKTVPVFSGDDEHSLAARIIVQEHAAYAEAIDRVLSGKYRFAGRRFVAAQTETE